MTEIKYKNAPVSEVICGVTFKSPVLAKENYFLKLISFLSDSYPNYQVMQPLVNEELIGHQMNLGVNYQISGPVLYRLRSPDSTWLVQIQHNKIYLNWIRDEFKEVGDYPGYTAIYGAFEEIVNKVKHDLSLTDEDCQYYDLTYHDRIPHFDYIDSLDQVNKLFNYGSPDLESIDNGIEIVNFNKSVNALLPELSGFMVFNFLTLTEITGKQILKLELSIKGGSGSLSEWFKLAHTKQVELFEKFINRELLSKWQ